MLASGADVGAHGDRIAERRLAVVRRLDVLDLGETRGVVREVLVGRIPEVQPDLLLEPEIQIERGRGHLGSLLGSVRTRDEDALEVVAHPGEGGRGREGLLGAVGGDAVAGLLRMTDANDTDVHFSSS